MEMLKKVITWGAIAFVVFFVAFRPAAAGEVIATLGDMTASIFRGVGDFFRSLVG